MTRRPTRFIMLHVSTGTPDRFCQTVQTANLTFLVTQDLHCIHHYFHETRIVFSQLNKSKKFLQLLYQCFTLYYVVAKVFSRFYFMVLFFNWLNVSVCSIVILHSSTVVKGVNKTSKLHRLFCKT